MDSNVEASKSDLSTWKTPEAAIDVPSLEREVFRMKQTSHLLDERGISPFRRLSVLR